MIIPFRGAPQNDLVVQANQELLIVTITSQDFTDLMDNFPSKEKDKDSNDTDPDSDPNGSPNKHGPSAQGN